MRSFFSCVEYLWTNFGLESRSPIVAYFGSAEFYGDDVTDFQELGSDIEQQFLELSNLDDTQFIGG